MDDAACKGQSPNLFILDQGYTASEAVKFCRRCDVPEECAAYARRTGSIGIWGGKLFTQRYSQPVELLPIRSVQDARPVSVISQGTLRRLPSVLGAAASFRHPGILGLPK